MLRTLRVDYTLNIFMKQFQIIEQHLDLFYAFLYHLISNTISKKKIEENLSLLRRLRRNLFIFMHEMIMRNGEEHK